jgi:serine/threonine-protein kinase
MLPLVAAESARVTTDRYRVLGRLGHGGMAEILLAKATGPGGFERLVVIKRLLSHLRDDATYVGMFLDEARIVARIRHRNVVQVHDLYEIDGDYWLVMEFLEGESAARLFGSLGRSDPSLAAYVVCEAANGLHAAHELVTPDGRPCNVVHRDISPQNIFVTYGGDVKLLDFGIARADDRSLRTESGVLKGKLEYMAPEQLTSGTVDRRTDLFALGVVLYELATARRLFKRKGEVEVIQAICYQPIPRPSEIVPDFPPGLEPIVMRALERDPSLRYQTAGEMAKELAIWLASAEPVTAVRDRLGTTIVTAFPDRTEAKRALAASDPSTELVAFAGVFGQEASAPASPSHTGTRPTRSAAPPSRLWIALVALAAFMVLASGAAGVAGYFLFSTEHPVARVDREPPEARETPVAPAMIEETMVDVAMVEAAAPEGDVAPPEPAAPQAPATIELSIATQPSGAIVSGPGGASCRSPCTLTVPRSSEAIALSARAHGRVAHTRVAPTEDRRVELTLRRPEPVASEPVATPMMDSPFEAFD